MRFEVTAPVTIQISRYAEATKEVGDQSFCYCRRLLIGNCAHFRLFLPKEHRHCTGACGPYSYFAARDWLHRCRTVGPISQYRLSLGASRISAEPYWGFCWHPSDFLTVHYVIRLILPSLEFCLVVVVLCLGPLCHCCIPDHSTVSSWTSLSGFLVHYCPWSNVSWRSFLCPVTHLHGGHFAAGVAPRRLEC
jgi:hypothetical protein